MIFIPTKGRDIRPRKKRTWDYLREEGLDFTLVVEPQDVERYQNEGPLIVLPEDDRGIAYARRFILDSMVEPSWVLDDDLNSCAKWTENGIERSTYRETMEACDNVPDNAFICGPSFVQTARGEMDPRETQLNRIVACFYKIYPDRVVVNYDPEQKIFSDVRFILENILKGRASVRFRRALFRCAPIGEKQTESGGLEYQSGVKNRAADKFVAEVPHCSKVWTAAQKTRIRVDWRAVDAHYRDVRS